MKLRDFTQHMKRMSLSIVMMLLITFGMATKNTWLQPTWIVLGFLALQFGYQVIKTARQSKMVESNTRDAVRAKREIQLFNASERDVNKAKEKAKDLGEMSMGKKMLIMLVVPLAIFISSGYVLSIFGVEQWQSYMVGFLLSMPISTVLTIKMGIAPGAMAVTPNSYIITEGGVAFDHLSQSFIVRFPLTNINVQKEKRFIEIETKTEATVIPNKLRLFTDKLDPLYKILAKHSQIKEN